jgi:hypothetical protein
LVKHWTENPGFQVQVLASTFLKHFSSNLVRTLPFHGNNMGSNPIECKKK